MYSVVSYSCIVFIAVVLHYTDDICSCHIDVCFTFCVLLCYCACTFVIVLTKDLSIYPSVYRFIYLHYRSLLENSNNHKMWYYLAEHRHLQLKQLTLRPSRKVLTTTVFYVEASEQRSCSRISQTYSFGEYGENVPAKKTK